MALGALAAMSASAQAPPTPDTALVRRRRACLVRSIIIDGPTLLQVFAPDDIVTTATSSAPDSTLRRLADSAGALYGCASPGAAMRDAVTRRAFIIEPRHAGAVVIAGPDLSPEFVRRADDFRAVRVALQWLMLTLAGRGR